MPPSGCCAVAPAHPTPAPPPRLAAARLELSEDSEAAPVALPASDVPAAGAWVTQTAWEVPESTIL